MAMLGTRLQLPAGTWGGRGVPSCPCHAGPATCARRRRPPSQRRCCSRARCAGAGQPGGRSSDGGGGAFERAAWRGAELGVAVLQLHRWLRAALGLHDPPSRRSGRAELVWAVAGGSGRRRRPSAGEDRPALLLAVLDGVLLRCHGWWWWLSSADFSQEAALEAALAPAISANGHVMHPLA